MPKRPIASFSGTRNGWRFNSTLASPLGSVTSAGYSRHSTQGSGVERVFGQYAVVYVLDGEAAYSDAHGMRQDLGPGDVIIVFPELAHTYGPRRDIGSGRWTTLWLSFGGTVFDLWREQGLLDDHRPIYHLEPVDAWLRRFDSILGPLRQAGYSPPLPEVCRLQSLLAEIVIGAGRPMVYQDELRWVSRACALLDSASGAESDWKTAAGHLGMTPETFRKRFTRLAGHPPARYRMHRLIDRACELIQERRLTDKEIADALGFCDEYYFSRRFKQIIGHSPRAFRRLIQSRMIAKPG
ncbi:MAG TPA: AraC family transcriptional regulator [Chthoniobacteraceae bacterium]|nr:AraC family transcriptional regulator [Chthoniobacteraceae bacterium]